MSLKDTLRSGQRSSSARLPLAACVAATLALASAAAAWICRARSIQAFDGARVALARCGACCEGWSDDAVLQKLRDAVAHTSPALPAQVSPPAVERKKSEP